MSQDQTVPSRYLLVLVMVDASIQAALLSVGSSSEVVATSEIKTFGSDKEFVVATDHCLQELGPESEGINETICLISPEWMNGDNLNELGQSFLQNLQKQLGLELVGFLNVVEAMAASLVVESGKRILLLITEHKGIATLIGEKGVGRQHIFARSGDQAELIAAFDTMKAELADEEIQDLVIASPTFGDLKLEQEKVALSDIADQAFDQVLTVLVVSREKATSGLLEQAGGAITGVEPPAIEVTHQEDLTELASSDEPQPASGEDMIEDVQEGKEEGDVTSAESEDAGAFKNPDDNLSVVDLAEENKDSADAHPEQQTAHKVITKAEDHPTATSFGVPVPLSRLDMHSKKKTDLTEAEAGQLSDSSTAPKMHILSKKQLPKLLWMVGGAVSLGLVAVIVIGWVFIWQTAKVMVEVTLATKQLNQSTTITIDPTLEASDPQNNTLVAEVIQEAATNSAKTATTGIKIVGEKATGKIVIYNKTSQDKTFDVGTTFKKDALEYSLTESVTVPSATESASEKKYGNKEAKVIASKIGVEHNLTQKNDLSVASFSNDTYSAQTAVDFTGGSSREIRVVAPEDQKKLRDALKLDLTGATTKQLEALSKNGKYVIPTGKVTIVTEQFDADVGDEVEELNLTLGVVAQGIEYKTEDLLPLATDIITKAVPEGYTLSADPPQVLSSPVDQVNTTDAFKLEVDISAKAIPNVTADDLKQAMIGRGVTDIPGVLKEKSSVKDVQVKIKPALGQYVMGDIKNLDRVELTIKQ